MAAKQHRPQSQAGFTLIELMISMGIILTITIAAFSLMDGAMRTSATFYEQTEAQQNLRITQDHINRDLTDTGYKLANISDGLLRVPLDFTQTYISANPVGTVTTGPADEHYVRLRLVTSDDDVPAALSDVLTGTDRITTIRSDIRSDDEIDGVPTFPLSVLRRVGASGDPIVKPNLNTFRVDLFQTRENTDPVRLANIVNKFRVGEVYLFDNSSTAAALGVVTAVTTGPNASVTFAGGDAYGLNKNGVPHLTKVAYPDGYANNAIPEALTITRIQLVTYFVDADGLLRRRVFGRPRPVATPVEDFIADALAGEVIAEHFTDLQFRYEVRDEIDPNVVLTVDSLTEVQQALVRQAEFQTEAETAHAVGGAKDAEHHYGKLRTSSTTRTSLRNVVYGPADQRFN